MFELRFDPQLVEEAVFLSMKEAAGPAFATWDAERDAGYAAADPAERDAIFRRLSSRWFEELHLAEPILFASRECEWVRRRTELVIVRRALRRADEGSELFVPEGRWSDSKIRLLLGVCARRFVQPSILFELTLRELLFAEDMLDPAFGYEPRLPAELDDDLARRELVRDRFRVLWEARIEARRRKVAGEPVEGAPTRDFARAFGAPADSAHVLELYRFARSPEAGRYSRLVDAAVAALPPATIPIGSL